MVFITCTAIAAGSNIDPKRKSLPWTIDSQTQPWENHEMQHTLVRSRRKARRWTWKASSAGEKASMFPCAEGISLQWSGRGECEREIRIKARLQVSGPSSRAPLPLNRWEAASEGHLDRRAGRLHSIIKWKIMGGVRLIKHFWAFTKGWGPPFSRDNALGQNGLQLSR